MLKTQHKTIVERGQNFTELNSLKIFAKHRKTQRSPFSNFNKYLLKKSKYLSLVTYARLPYPFSPQRTIPDAHESD